MQLTLSLPCAGRFLKFRQQPYHGLLLRYGPANLMPCM